MFDWPRFLDAHSIPHITSGPNVARDNIGVHCPFCGPEDQSYHMSISLAGKGWCCWRKEGHRGKNPARLIQSLLGCSWEYAAQLVGLEGYVVSENFMEQVRASFAQTTKAPAGRSLHLPKEFRAFGKETIVTRPYFNYLKDRGFQPDRLTKRYGVHFATLGAFKGRIIFTVHFEGRLVGWTARTIFTDGHPRYLALTTDEARAKQAGLEPAVGPLTNYLLWYDRLIKSDADTLYLCEGPFDALKVSTLGRKHGIVATCFFTSSPSSSQLDALHELLPRFKHRALLLDEGTLHTAIRITGSLSGLGLKVILLPSNVKDPGELNETELLGLGRRVAAA